MPPPWASTGTDLDKWLGGLPADGITIVQAPVGCGRTTFLRAVAHGVHARRGTVHWNGVEPFPGGSAATPPFPVVVHTSLQDLILHVTALNPGRSDLVVIDDAGSYPHFPTDPSFSSEAARLWASFARHVAALDAPVLMAAQTRSVGAGTRGAPGLGRGAVFTATLILEMEPVARTGGDAAGMVTEVRIVKSRRQQPGASTKFWLRPGRENPLVFA